MLTLLVLDLINLTVKVTKITPSDWSRYSFIFLLLAFLLQILFLFFGWLTDFIVHLWQYGLLLVTAFFWFIAYKHRCFNQISLDAKSLRCSYTLYGFYSLGFWGMYRVAREFPVDTIGYVSFNSLRRLPFKLGLTSISSLRESLFVRPHKIKTLSSFLFADPAPSWVTVVFKNGRSTVLYIKPFGQVGADKIFDKLNQLGVSVVY